MVRKTEYLHLFGSLAMYDYDKNNVRKENYKLGGGTYHQKLIVLVVSSFLIANIVLFISEIGRNFIIKNKKIFFENSFNE